MLIKTNAIGVSCLMFLLLTCNGEEILVRKRNALPTNPFLIAPLNSGTGALVNSGNGPVTVHGLPKTLVPSQKWTRNLRQILTVPEKDQFVFMSRDRIALVTVADDKLVLESELEINEPRGGAISPDGTRIILFARDEMFYDIRISNNKFITRKSYT